MILLASTDTLQVLLAGAITTSQGVLYASFADIATDGTTFEPSPSSGETNNTTAVNWVAAPASGSRRQIKYLSLYNADTVSMTVTVRFVDNGTNRILLKVPLATGERIEYNIDTGFSVISASGTVTATVPDGDKGDITVSGGGATWTIDNNAVTNAKLADMSEATVKLRAAGAGVGDPIDGTAAQLAVIAQGDGLDVDACGFRGIPQNSQSGNYTCLASDAGKSIDHPSGAGAGDTYTIPSNASVAYEIGTAITFTNMDSNTVAIAITSDTMNWAPTGTTGTRTLAQYGVATARKVASTAWLISGVGLS